MTKKPTIWIAFAKGGKIPAGLAGDAERVVAPHEPVEVEAVYGRSLVADRFAVEVDGRKAAKAAAGSTVDKAAEGAGA